MSASIVKMNTKRRSVDRRKTQKRKFRGKGGSYSGSRAAVAVGEKNEIVKEKSGAICILPIK